MIGVKRDEIVMFLDNYLEINKYRKLDYSYNGLIIEGKEYINKVLGVTNLTLNSINYAFKNDFDLIISHHNIFWKTQPIYIKKSLKEKLKLILNKDVNIYVAHLPLDFHKDIGNWKYLVDLLIDYIKDYKLDEEYYITKIKLKKPVNIALVLEEVKKKLRYYLFGDSRVDSIIFCPGSCSNLILNYLIENRDKVDLILTGEVKMSLYEYCLENNINLIEIGHYYSERYGIKRLLEVIKKKFNVYVEYFEEEIEK